MLLAEEQRILAEQQRPAVAPLAPHHPAPSAERAGRDAVHAADREAMFELRQTVANMAQEIIHLRLTPPRDCNAPTCGRTKLSSPPPRRSRCHPTT